MSRRLYHTLRATIHAKAAAHPAAMPHSAVGTPPYQGSIMHDMAMMCPSAAPSITYREAATSSPPHNTPSAAAAPPGHQPMPPHTTSYMTNMQAAAHPRPSHHTGTLRDRTSHMAAGASARPASANRTTSCSIDAHRTRQ